MDNAIQIPLTPAYAVPAEPGPCICGLTHANPRTAPPPRVTITTTAKAEPERKGRGK